MLFAQNEIPQPVSPTPGTSTLGFGRLDPNRYGLPGSDVALNLLGGLIFYGLILVLVGLIISAGVWAVGGFSNNHTQNYNGKRGFLICAVCALVIGAAYYIVQWFYGAGLNVQ